MEASQKDAISIIDQLSQVGDVANVFKFSNGLLDNVQKQQNFECLVKSEDTPPLIKAKAQAELAELLGSNGDIHLKEKLRDSARAILAKEHYHAALDIDISRSIEGIQERHEHPTFGNLDNLLSTYRSLDYPNGMQRWLYKLVDIATSIHNLEVQHSLGEELKALSIKTGTLAFLLLLQVNNVARFHTNTGYDDLVKTTLVKTYSDLVQFGLPYPLGQVCFMLVDLFTRLEDVDQALEWADRCVLHWKTCPPETQSAANLQLLRAKILEFEERNSIDFKGLQTFCEELVATDLANDLRQEAVMKLDIMHGLIYSRKEIPVNERFAHIEEYLARSESIINSMAGSNTGHQKAGLLQQQATFRISYGSHRKDIEMENEAIELLKQALQLTHAASNWTLTYQLITLREQMGLVCYACFTKLLSSDTSKSKEYLDCAEECFVVCLTGREAMGTTAQVAEDKYWIALLRYEKRVQGWISSEEVLQSLSNAENGFDALRIEISMSSGISAVKAKQVLAKRKHVRDIYRFAFQVCILDWSPSGAWQWVQKAKARSLSDMLGLGCLIPETLLSRITKDDQASEMYEREQGLSQQLQSVAPADSFNVAIELRKVQAQMESIPVLKEMLDLRQGKAVTAEELLSRWQKLPVGRYVTDVAFIDWYVKGEDEIYILVLRPTAETILRRVHITPHKVREWIKAYLHSEDGVTQSIGRRDDHPNQALRELDVLVESIADCVDPDALLVLSSAAPMDALPLHALHVSSSSDPQAEKSLPLIERNPVVYCSNMTVFVQCCESAASKSVTPEFTTSLMAVYEDTPSEPFNIVEQKAVYDSIGELASEHHTLAAVGGEVSRGRIVEEWPSADYILFHGHCDLSSKDITEQSLIFASDSNGADGSSVPRLAVKEVFDLKLNKPLVALMACGSSTQRISAGDEPLGLVTALLCAGAASVIGTLWPVASGTARRFTAVFREQFKVLQAESSNHPTVRAEPTAVSSVIDLAVAVQRTIRELKETGPRWSRTPEHWAPFVIHGAAFLRASISKA